MTNDKDRVNQIPTSSKPNAVASSNCWDLFNLITNTPILKATDSIDLPASLFVHNHNTHY